MKIEKLVPSQRKEGWWLVTLEDGSLLRVSRGEMADFALYQGMELDEDTLTALQNATEVALLKEKALNVLSVRPVSRRELVDKLSRQPRRRDGQRPDAESLERRRAIASVVADRMEELGLLNDGEYAVRVAQHYAAKGYGAQKIRAELYHRGVPREYWEEALEQLSDSSDTLDALLAKRLRGWDGDPKDLKRASDWLARRGFSWSEISSALRRYK